MGVASSASLWFFWFIDSLIIGGTLFVTHIVNRWALPGRAMTASKSTSTMKWLLLCFPYA
jgi:hypothetical protein